MQKIPIVVFAQTPPPEHGQSRMVLEALKSLYARPDVFDVHHVDARFSQTLEDIGESSFGKLILTGKYLCQAMALRWKVKRPLLYYVPGPVKWSSVLRDWLLLSVLRVFYGKAVFHWHAIGQGEWAHGSKRAALGGPRWLDFIARKISKMVLGGPFCSIAVSSNSTKDASAVDSRWTQVICNGIEDPCPDFTGVGQRDRQQRQFEIMRDRSGVIRILFLSHGTEEKGLFDAVKCIDIVLETGPSEARYHITFAGGISSLVRGRFDEAKEELLARWTDRLTLQEIGYVDGEEKQRCFCGHDIFLAPSRWESFGLTVVEAMANGMAVVAAASDGVAGVLTKDYPYLAPVAAPQELAKRLNACCRMMRDGGGVECGLGLRAAYLENYRLDEFSTRFASAMYDLAIAAGGNVRSKSVAADDALVLKCYLGDQNPRLGRSLGIARMSEVVLGALSARDDVVMKVLVSKSSQQGPLRAAARITMPWGTRNRLARLLSDHCHPWFIRSRKPRSLWYYPKGFLPLETSRCRPAVVTVHDTIIEHCRQTYPSWRRSFEYSYWAWMLAHALRSADRIMTVSQSSKAQITQFMRVRGIPEKEITVTYEPCLYESIPQPERPRKQDYVLHLASREPHKRTSHLVRWWLESSPATRPTLHIVGHLPADVADFASTSPYIVIKDFLDDAQLRKEVMAARALILPSEIEGFGLPALEAYYLGTPVCYVLGTSVEEILEPTTKIGGFDLQDSSSLFRALDDVLKMSPEEVQRCGLKLREIYAVDRVIDKMMTVFREVATTR